MCTGYTVCANSQCTPHRRPWRVFHIKWVELRETSLVRGHSVAPVGLVRTDLPLLTHVVEVLLRVAVSLGRYPARRVHGRAPRRGAVTSASLRVKIEHVGIHRTPHTSYFGI